MREVFEVRFKEAKATKDGECCVKSDGGFYDPAVAMIVDVRDVSRWLGKTVRVVVTDVMDEQQGMRSGQGAGADGKATAGKEG